MLSISPLEPQISSMSQPPVASIFYLEWMPFGPAMWNNRKPPKRQVCQFDYLRSSVVSQKFVAYSFDLSEDEIGGSGPAE